MSIREKIKAINNKIKQNNSQYNLDRKASKFQLYHQEITEKKQKRKKQICIL